MKYTHSLFARTMAVLAAVLCAAAVFAGCSNSPSAVVTPVDENTTTRSTIAIPKGQMSIHDVLIKSGSGLNLKWSDVSPYTHTDIDDANAVFDVTDEYGMTYTLTVKRNGETLESAVLSRGEFSVDIRTGSVTEFWRKVMLAENRGE